MSQSNVTEKEYLAELRRYADALGEARNEVLFLWKTLNAIQEVSNEVGLLGMVGSPAWISQLKRCKPKVHAATVEDWVHVGGNKIITNNLPWSKLPSGTKLFMEIYNDDGKDF